MFDVAGSDLGAPDQLAPDQLGPDQLVAELLEGLTPAQHRAVTSDASPLCVLAGAGAGKTRVLTRRIAYRVATGSADPGHVLALTFTRKAAGELEQRLAKMGQTERVVAGTFHSVASAQLRRWWADRGWRPPTLLTRKARLIGALAFQRPNLERVPVSDLAGIIEWAQARLVTPERLAELAAAGEIPAVGGPGGRGLPVPVEEIASLYARYQHEKRRRGVLDFDDLLARCAEAIETDPVFAAAQRWRWRHVFVDEFQDLNPLQHRLLLAWLGPEGPAGTAGPAGAQDIGTASPAGAQDTGKGSPDLCAVGDPNQAIYGWNGADPTLLADIPNRWPGAEVVRLDDNHRCSPQVLTAATAVLADAGSALTSTCPDGPIPTVTQYTSEAAEAAGVAAALRTAYAEGLGWGHMAVLVRTNAQTVALRRVFEEQGIPHQVPGGQRLLDHDSVKQALADLDSRADLPLAMWVADLDETLRRDGPDPALTALLSLAREYIDLGAEAGAPGFTSWLPTAATDVPRSPSAPSAGAEAEVGAGSSGAVSPGAGSSGAVFLGSFHRAKGLEWQAVWVCGLEEGLVPFGRRPSPAQEAEERRLLYVALTRASTRLHCTWSSSRSFGAATVPRRPSPWLAAIESRFGGQSTAAREEELVDADKWRARIRQQREALGTGHKSRSGTGPARQKRRQTRPEKLAGADPDLVAALSSWRTRRARGAGVPAHVVLHDRTLAAVATLRPKSIDELVSVPGIGPLVASRFGDEILDVLGVDTQRSGAAVAEGSTPAVA